MVQSVELVLDEVTDAAVRAQWHRLLDAGLPSQARHTGASNRPHITLTARPQVPPGLDDDLGRAVGPLPLPVVLGGLLCFPGRRAVLARHVVASVELVAMQLRVRELLDDRAGSFDHEGHFGPGRWTPHVTLARGLTPDQIGSAVALLATGAADADGAAVTARRWDGDARRTWDLPSA